MTALTSYDTRTAQIVCGRAALADVVKHPDGTVTATLPRTGVILADRATMPAAFRAAEHRDNTDRAAMIREGDRQIAQRDAHYARMGWL